MHMIGGWFSVCNFGDFWLWFSVGGFNLEVVREYSFFQVCDLIYFQGSW